MHCVILLNTLSKIYFTPKMLQHHAILLSNQANKTALIHLILSKKSTEKLAVFNELEGILFSVTVIQNSR